MTASTPQAPGADPQQANGQTGVLIPTLRGWTEAVTAFTGSRVLAARFVLANARTATSLKFRIATGGTGNIDVAILDATGSRLASAGSTSGKKGASTTQTVNLSASVALTAGTVYYAAIASDVSDGTLAVADLSNGVEQAFGATIGLAEGFIKDTTFPIPASVPIGFVSAQPCRMHIV